MSMNYDNPQLYHKNKRRDPITKHGLGLAKVSVVILLVGNIRGEEVYYENILYYQQTFIKRPIVLYSIQDVET